MAKEWASLQTEIRRLYYEQNKPLAEVMRLVKGRHGFHASERSYRTQLRKWGYMKYSTESCPKPKRVRERSGVAMDLDPSSSSISRPVAGSIFMPSAANPSFFVADDSEYPGPLPDGARDSRTRPRADANYPMLEASRLGAVESSEDLNEQDSNGSTRLHHAVTGGPQNRQEVQALLQAGAAVNVKDGSGREALHCAIHSQDLENVKLLLRFGADENAKCSGNVSPLQLAVSNKAIIDVLLASGASVYTQDDEGNTALHSALMTASAYGSSEIFYAETPISVVETLVKHGSDVNAPNGLGFTSFHLLVDQEYVSKHSIFRHLENFLDCGASLSTPFPDQRLPFQVFLVRTDRPWRDWVRFEPIFQRFIYKGADPTTRVPSGDPVIIHLIQECMGGWGSRADRVMKVLLSMCETVHLGKIHHNGNSALHELCLLEETRHMRLGPKPGELVSTLLRRGADPNLVNKDGQTPLLLGLISRNFSYGYIDILLANGANPSIRDNMGRCALFEALTTQSGADWLPRLIRSFLEHRIEMLQNSGAEDDVSGTEGSDDASLQSLNKSTSLQSLNEAAFLQSFDKAVTSESWEKVKNTICDQNWSLHSKEIDPKIRLAVFTVLGEKRLEAIKALTASDESAEMARRQACAVEILRDFRVWEVEVKIEHWDLLLGFVQLSRAVRAAGAARAPRAPGASGASRAPR